MACPGYPRDLKTRMIPAPRIIDKHLAYTGADYASFDSRDHYFKTVNTQSKK